jgi:hypothetical protein
MLNKAMINNMLEMPDEKLTTMLKIVLSASGIDLGGKKLDEKTVKRLRALLSEVTDGDIQRATYLIDKYKRGG